jgi:hypothetical protein
LGGTQALLTYAASNEATRELAFRCFCDSLSFRYLLQAGIAARMAVHTFLDCED